MRGLVDQSYAPAFLLLVHEDSGFGLCDQHHGRLYLIAAIASFGRKHIPRKTLRVNTYEGRLPGIGISRDQGDGLLP